MSDIAVQVNDVRVLPLSDPIASRIDTYLAALAALERDHVAARERLHTEFKADVAALVQKRLAPAPVHEADEAETARVHHLIEDSLRRVIGKGMERHGIT